VGERLVVRSSVKNTQRNDHWINFTGGIEQYRFVHRGNLTQNPKYSPAVSRQSDLSRRSFFATKAVYPLPGALCQFVSCHTSNTILRFFVLPCYSQSVIHGWHSLLKRGSYVSRLQSQSKHTNTRQDITGSQQELSNSTMEALMAVVILAPR
jgi:hypothetical protein